MLKSQLELQFGIIYRSLNSSSEIKARIYELIKKVSKDHTNLTLIGEFNFSKINWTTWSVESGQEENKFLDVLTETYMMHCVTEPIRYRSSECPHILDLVMSNAYIITDRLSLITINRDQCV